MTTLKGLLTLALIATVPVLISVLFVYLLGVAL